MIYVMNILLTEKLFEFLVSIKKLTLMKVDT